MKSNYIIKFELPDTSWWTKLWCKHEWGYYWKKLSPSVDREQIVCRLCGKEKK